MLQDKALRRISELKEQSTLEQNAKRHLEEELRSEMEEKEHVIQVLQTKVSLLKSKESGEAGTVEDSLIDLGDHPSESGSAGGAEGHKVAHLEGKTLLPFLLFHLELKYMCLVRFCRKDQEARVVANQVQGLHQGQQAKDLGLDRGQRKPIDPVVREGIRVRATKCQGQRV